MTIDIAEFAPFKERMQAEGLPDLFIQTFAYYYQRLVEGQTGMMPESEIQAVDSLPDADTLPDSFTHLGRDALSSTAIIKLNGGLGTSMGLAQAKSLLSIKNGLSFLEIIAHQAQEVGVPLILMNSFATEADSVAVLQQFDNLNGDLPLSFLQHKEPRVSAEDFTPAHWPDNPALEWCPPGHGDIYTALITSGTLNALLDAGYRYAFVSNSDNLGATIDETILGYFADGGFPFMMEVADRTRMDRKGGHLAQLEDGQFVLRESAQCPDEDMDQFQDITRHKYFNTNNLWLNLEKLRAVMAEQDNQLHLPMIRNQKTIDSRDPSTPKVYQIETAMGSAIAVFEGSQALRVPRSRFAPVKRTNDLLTVRSDVYELTDDYHVVPVSGSAQQKLLVDLDDRFYKYVPDLEARFPHGAPSLIECSSLTITGDVVFGRGVVCKGDVVLVNDEETPITIPDGTVLTG